MRPRRRHRRNTLRRYDEKLINLQDKPQWYLDIVPTTLVPAIEWHDENWKADTPGSGALVWESKDILEILDARFAETPLRSADDEVKEVVEVLNASVGFVYGARNGTTADDKGARFAAALDALDAVAADGGGREPRKIDVALGEVHGALARLHCEGRWTQALPDAASALLHAATGAARGDARCAYALARWHRRLPHPLLPAAPGCDVDLPAAPAPLDLDGPCLAPTAVWKSTGGMRASRETSNLSRSATSTSIRLIFGRIDRSRRVLEAPQKSSRRNGRIRAH